MTAPTSDTQFALADTRSGKVRGRWREGDGVRSAAFLGIPFAQPPVGELRFAAPQPVTPWEGVRDALEYGPTPLRDDSADTLIPEPAIPGDATLNVNVFTPSPGDRGANLPVMVWIHGGGFTAGSPAGPWYDGASFNRDGVILVTMSYRLGFIGFGMVKGAPQNRAILDWLAGLRWVQDNIAAFGGDPGRVTIAGQSAGGGAVLTLLGMESAQDLFSGAISISGVIADVNKRDAHAVTKRLCRRLKVAPTREELSAVSEEKLLEAQDKALALTRPSQYVKTLTDGMEIGPLVDGVVLRRPTLRSLSEGVGADKPLLIGATDDEFSLVLLAQEPALKWVPRRALARMMGLRGERYETYLAANPDIAARGNVRFLGRFVTDTLFRTEVRKVVRDRGDAPSWVYRFTSVQPETNLAIHCIDVPFWFDCLASPGVDRLTGPRPSQQVATALHGAAVRFISTGDPGWPRWTEADERVEAFGDNLSQLGLVETTSEDEATVLQRESGTDPASVVQVTVAEGYREVVPLLS